MSNCVKCGAKLPSFTFGAASPYCKTCRSDVPPEPRPGVIDAIPQAAAASASTPATYVLAAINVAIFGMVTGLLIGFFLARTLSSPAEERPAQSRMIFAVSALILLVLFIPIVKARAYAVEFGKGQAAFDQEDYKAAIEHLQRFTAAQPDNALGHALLGWAFQKEHRVDDAVREYEHGLAINPNYHYIQVNLAELYLYQKKPDKAVPLFRKGIPSTNVDANLMYSYGSALKQTGNLAEAEEALRKSIQLNDKNAGAHALLAEVLQAEGKTKEAQAESKRAEELDQAKDAEDEPAPKKQ